MSTEAPSQGSNSRTTAHTDAVTGVTVPTLPAWRAGSGWEPDDAGNGIKGLQAWCASDGRFHWLELPYDEDRDAPGYFTAETCRATRLHTVRVIVQPGSTPHRNRKGNWCRHDPTKGYTPDRAAEPPSYLPSPLPAALDWLEPAESESVVTDEPCGYCGVPMLRCEECGSLGCPCDEHLCPECGYRWPHTHDVASYPKPCDACDTEEARALDQWEEQPLDPDDDLILLRKRCSPPEVAHVEAMQRTLAGDPVYQVVKRIGGRYREAYLAEVTQAGFDLDAGREYFDQNVCECEPLATLQGERQVYRRHRDANKCRFCRVLEALEEQQHDRLLDEWHGEGTAARYQAESDEHQVDERLAWKRRDR